MKNRRRAPRSKLSQPVRVRPFDPNCPGEVCTTLNVSRSGLYFETSAGHYFSGMEVYVTRNFQPGDPMNREEIADVVRVEKVENGKWGVAIRILMRANTGPQSGE
jgi:hypothetical protein